MAERRSLTAAVHSPVPGVSPDLVRSFVTQTPSPKSLSAGEDQKSKPMISKENTANDGADPKPKAKRSSRFKPIGLIPVTVRLQPEIAGALKRASLERELDGEEVFTQQDIVEQALAPYLKRAGFLD